MMEKILGILVIIVLLLLVNPFWMPTAMQMSVLAFLALAFLIFASFVWKEKAVDEREQLHNYIASKFGFLAGAAVLTVGIIYQGIDYMVDKWLLAALGVMVLAKIIGHMYGQKKK